MEKDEETNDDGYWVIDGIVTDIKAEGEQGEQGKPGEQGPAGETGPQGPQGEQGERGSKWFYGSGTPSAEVTEEVLEGDMYYCTTNNTVRYYEDGAWSLIASLTGGTIGEADDPATLQEIIDATFTNCTFGAGQGCSHVRPYDDTTFINCTFSEEMTLDAGAEIAIEGNTVYGATVGSTEYFSILDLWQSGGNTYNDLTIAMKGNALFCEADADSDVYIAEVEASVNGTGHTLTMSGNTINGKAAGADRVLNGAAEDGGSDLAVVEE